MENIDDGDDDVALLQEMDKKYVSFVMNFVGAWFGTDVEVGFGALINIAVMPMHLIHIYLIILLGFKLGFQLQDFVEYFILSFLCTQIKEIYNFFGELFSFFNYR